MSLKDKEQVSRKAEDDRITRLDGQRREIWTKELDRLYQEFDRMSIKTKNNLDKSRDQLIEVIKAKANLVLNSSLEALQKGFQDVSLLTQKKLTDKQ